MISHRSSVQVRAEISAHPRRPVGGNTDVLAGAIIDSNADEAFQRGRVQPAPHQTWRTWPQLDQVGWRRASSDRLAVTCRRPSACMETSSQCTPCVDVGVEEARMRLRDANTRAVSSAGADVDRIWDRRRVARGRSPSRARLAAAACSASHCRLRVRSEPAAKPLLPDPPVRDGSRAASRRTGERSSRAWWTHPVITVLPADRARLRAD